jgi:hypothetical protein
MSKKTLRPEITLHVRFNKSIEKVEFSILRDNIKRMQCLPPEKRPRTLLERIVFDVHKSVTVSGFNVLVEVVDENRSRIGLLKGSVEEGFYARIDEILGKYDIRITLFSFGVVKDCQKKEVWVLSRKDKNNKTTTLSREENKGRYNISRENRRGRQYRGKKALRR